jgi:hypothetical protein
MAEPVYGLTAGAIRALTPIVRHHNGRLPDAGRRTRKVYDPGSGMRRFRITQTLDDDGITHVAIYRTSHVDGFDAHPVDANDSQSGPDRTIYADHVRSVFRTDDYVWCKAYGGDIQIVDHGRVHWTGVSLENIAPGDSGEVSLQGTGTVTVSAHNWSANQYIATDDEVRIEWEDEEQRFLIVATKCSEIV